MKKSLIFENERLYDLIKDYLADDDEFFAQLDKLPAFTYGIKLGDMSGEERLKILKGHVIGNVSRTYILQTLALKRLCSLLLKDAKNFTDSCWQSALNECLKGETKD